MAARAASLTSGGAGKSGNPCARLTASYCNARRVISRMTDSVKYSAFSESINLAVLAILSGVGFASAGLVMLILESGKKFTGEHHRARQTPVLYRNPRVKKPWQGSQVLVYRFAGKARHCAPRSERIRESG